jgi:hypothetical protein
MTPVQETPQIFTLILLLGVLTTLVVFLIIIYRLLGGRRTSAVKWLGIWALSALGYLAVSVMVSITRLVRLVEQGQDWCFDDWCIAVERVHERPSANDQEKIVTADLRIYNAARSPEGARGFWAYLCDQDGRRYPPTPGGWQETVLTRVPPHEAARTSIDFVVPKDARQLGFVTGHGSGTPCGLLPSVLEIGQGGCLFHEPDRIRIQ